MKATKKSSLKKRSKKTSATKKSSLKKRSKKTSKKASKKKSKKTHIKKTPKNTSCCECCECCNKKQHIQQWKLRLMPITHRDYQTTKKKNTMVCTKWWKIRSMLLLENFNYQSIQYDGLSVPFRRQT